MGKTTTLNELNSLIECFRSSVSSATLPNDDARELAEQTIPHLAQQALSLTPDQWSELSRCQREPDYFIRQYVKIEDTVAKDWILFDLWDGQADALSRFRANRRSVTIKARQQGFTWLALADALHEMIFNPIAVVLVFSKTDREAMDAVGHRLAGMYDNLPEWMKLQAVVKSRSNHNLHLSNGSRATAFPTTGGRSYSGTLAIVDEADYVENLDRLLAAVKPTVDAGGRLLLISTTDKAKPESVFKKIYRAGTGGGYEPMFYPWSIRPSRTPEWYAKEKDQCQATHGCLDLLWQEYPTTAEEALAANVLDKRFPPQWIAACYQPMNPLSFAGDMALHHLMGGAPSIPALKVFKVPEGARRYVIGADPAEGNPTSDDSSFDVLDCETREQVATLAGKFELAVFSSMIDAASKWYNDAPVMVERNNHGHAVILWLTDNSTAMVMDGFDDKAGWHTTTKGKAMLWDTAADSFRAGYERRHNEACIIHEFGSRSQLESIEGATNRAPEGLHDDRAVSFALALCGAATVPNGSIDIHFGPR